MRTMDRRNWLRTAGLSGGLLCLGGLEAVGRNIYTRSVPAGGPVLLNANENPYSPSQALRNALVDHLDQTCRYPFRALPDLVNRIAEKEGLSKDHIVVTGGSSEGLTTAGLIYGMNGGEIIAASPTFERLLEYAENFGAKVHRVPVNDQLVHDLEAMSARVNKKTRLIFLCNPNNPTGTILDRQALRDFCLSHEGKAVIFSDEAYYDFITDPDYPSMVELVKEGRNVIVSRTFSKVYGLAGLRIGYLVARPDIAEKLKKGVMAMTNVLAIAAAKRALEDDEFYKFSIARNQQAKEHIYSALESLRLRYTLSHTNFVFFETGRHIDQVIEAMRAQNIWIGRPFPPMYDWARVSTGTMEEMELFTSALKRVLR